MKKPKAPRLVTMAIITTMTIIFWIFFTVYRIFTSTPPAHVPEELMAPITPALKIEVLENIENRLFIEEGDIPDIFETEITPTPSPVETPTEVTPPATESAEISEQSPTPTLTVTESE